MSERTFTFTKDHFRDVQLRPEGRAFAPLGWGGPCLFSFKGEVHYAPDMANWRIVTEADFPMEVTQ